MPRHDWIDGGAMLSKNSRSARLVGAHQLAIPGHIGGQDTCESAFDAALPRSGHGVALSALFYTAHGNLGWLVVTPPSASCLPATFAQPVGHGAATSLGGTPMTGHSTSPGSVAGARKGGERQRRFGSEAARRAHSMNTVRGGEALRHRFLCRGRPFGTKNSFIGGPQLWPV